MKEYRFGVIGAGNMGYSMLKGMMDQGKVTQAGVYDVVPAAVQRAQALGATAFATPAELCKWADIVLLAVKPQMLKEACQQIGESAGEKAVASIVTGASVDTLKTLLGANVRVLRIMPNTPAMVGAGMCVLASNTDFLPEEKAFMDAALAAIGKVAYAKESQMDAVTALSGSGPAYVYLLIEAMTEAGVREGLAFDTAKLLAAQTVLGAAQMVLQQPQTHPAQLRAQVTSPAGTTAEALYTLEQHGFKGAVMEAVHAAADKAASLGRKS